MNQQMYENQVKELNFILEKLSDLEHSVTTTQVKNACSISMKNLGEAKNSLYISIGKEVCKSKQPSLTEVVQ